MFVCLCVPRFRVMIYLIWHCPPLHSRKSGKLHSHHIDNGTCSWLVTNISWGKKDTLFSKWFYIWVYAAPVGFLQVSSNVCVSLLWFFGVFSSIIVLTLVNNLRLANHSDDYHSNKSYCSWSKEMFCEECVNCCVECHSHLTWLLFIFVVVDAAAHHIISRDGISTWGETIFYINPQSMRLEHLRDIWLWWTH